MSLPDFLRSDLKGKVLLNVRLPPLSQCCNVKTYKVIWLKLYNKKLFTAKAQKKLNKMHTATYRSQARRKKPDCRF